MTDTAVASAEPPASTDTAAPHASSELSKSDHSTLPAAESTEDAALPTIEEVLDRCGFGSFQLALMAIVLCQSLTAGCLMTSVSFIFDALKEEWALDDTAIGQPHLRPLTAITNSIY